MSLLQSFTHRFSFVPFHFFPDGDNTEWHRSPSSIDGGTTKKHRAHPYSLLSPENHNQTQINTIYIRARKGGTSKMDRLNAQHRILVIVGQGWLWANLGFPVVRVCVCVCVCVSALTGIELWFYWTDCVSVSFLCKVISPFLLLQQISTFYACWAPANQPTASLSICPSQYLDHFESSPVISNQLIILHQLSLTHTFHHSVSNLAVVNSVSRKDILLFDVCSS